MSVTDQTVAGDVPADEPVAEAVVEHPVEPPTEPDAGSAGSADPAEHPQAPSPPSTPEPITPSPAEPPPVPEPPGEPVAPEPELASAVPADASEHRPPKAAREASPESGAPTATIDVGLSAAAETTTELAPPPVVTVEEEPAAAPVPPPRRLPWRAFLLGAVAAAIPLLAVIFLRGEDDTAERRRADALAESRQLALNLVSIDYKTLDRDLQRISDSTTGKAREEFDKQILKNDTYKKLFTDNQGVVTSKVQRIGLEPCGADDAACRRGDVAVVLVFLDQESKNKLRTTPRVDRNRVALTVVRRDDRWLVSEVKVL